MFSYLFPFTINIVQIYEKFLKNLIYTKKLSIFIFMKDTNTTKINITLPVPLIEKIKEGNYNRTQLLVSLLKKFSQNRKK